MERTLFDLAEEKYENSFKNQEILYENIVMDAIINDPDNVAQATKEYNEKIGNFDIAAYRKVVKILFAKLANEQSSEFDYYQLRFRALGRYAQFRNAFTTKCMEVLAQEGSSKDKNDLIDKMNRRRSEQHDLVISLFNDLNELADKNKIKRPYISNKLKFDKKLTEDRDAVATIVKIHEPLSETLRFIKLK